MKSEQASKTIREQIISCLQDREMNARQLSQVLGIKEKDVFDHLKHVEKSAASQGNRLVVEPFRCLSCGFVFRDRKRFARPGRCPTCRQTHVEDPVYRIR